MNSFSGKQGMLLASDLAFTASECCSFADKLRNKNIFLTGGTGFFGKWFLHSFLHFNRSLKLNASMTILSRCPERFLKENCCFIGDEALSFVKGDVRDFVVDHNSYDFLIHAATPASAKLEAEDPDEMYSIIVDGTKHVLDFAKQTGVKKILLTSSGAVYGVQPPELLQISEKYDPDPVTGYGKGKLESERLCIESGIDTVIARCFAFVGPFLPLDIHYAIGNFIRDALEGKDITVTGDGRPYRSYLYAADLMVWLWTILMEGVPGKAYNVGSENAVSIAELAKVISKCVSPNIGYSIIGKPNPDTPAPRYIPDTNKARAELGLRETCSLIDGIKKTVEWHQ